MTIQRFDQRIAGLENAVLKIQGMQGKFAVALDEQTKIGEKTVADLAQLSLDFDSLASRVDQHKILHNKHQEKYSVIDQVESALKTYVVRWGEVERRQNEFANKSSVEECKARTSLFADTLQAANKNLSTNELEDRESIKKLFANLSAISGDLSELRNKINALSSASDSTNNMIASGKVEWQSRLTKLVQDIGERIEKTVAEKAPAVDVQNVARIVKDMIKIELSNISIDSANASLKYNNLDAQVKLVEKKIENIFLVIKKMEISKQS
jgi:signal transduction histidine kinase